MKFVQLGKVVVSTENLQCISREDGTDSLCFRYNDGSYLRVNVNYADINEVLSKFCTLANSHENI